MAYVERVRKDEELARQIQDEEKQAMKFNGASYYDTAPTQRRFDSSSLEMAQDTDSHAIARELQEREVANMKRLQRDEELARQMQEAEKKQLLRFDDGGYYHEQEGFEYSTSKVSQDTGSPYNSLERDSVAASRPQPVGLVPFYEGKYQPCAETQPPIAESMCHYCKSFFPVQKISEHQVR